MTPNPGVPICICLHLLLGSLLNSFHFLSLWISSLSSCTLIIINFQWYWTTFFYSQPNSHYDASPYCKSQIQNHWWWLGEEEKIAITCIYKTNLQQLPLRFFPNLKCVFFPVFFCWPAISVVCVTKFCVYGIWYILVRLHIRIYCYICYVYIVYIST